MLVLQTNLVLLLPFGVLFAWQVLLGPNSFSSIASRLAELGVRLMLTEGEAAATAGTARPAAAAGVAALECNKQQLLPGARAVLCSEHLHKMQLLHTAVDAGTVVFASQWPAFYAASLPVVSHW